MSSIDLIEKVTVEQRGLPDWSYTGQAIKTDKEKLIQIAERDAALFEKTFPGIVATALGGVPVGLLTEDGKVDYDTFSKVLADTTFPVSLRFHYFIRLINERLFKYNQMNSLNAHNLECLSIALEKPHSEFIMEWMTYIQKSELHLEVLARRLAGYFYACIQDNLEIIVVSAEDLKNLPTIIDVEKTSKELAATHERMSQFFSRINFGRDEIFSELDIEKIHLGQLRQKTARMHGLFTETVNPNSYEPLYNNYSDDSATWEETEFLPERKKVSGQPQSKVTRLNKRNKNRKANKLASKARRK